MDPPPPSYTPGESGQWNRNSNGRATPGSDVSQCVTSLLDATKQLTECLRLWSIEKATDEQVSDIYVTIGTRFNLMVTAFIGVGIDISDLYSIPVDLRAHLEKCLGEEASPQILALYMPNIKATLYRLLIGLRGRQDAYWKAVGGRVRRNTASSR